MKKIQLTQGKFALVDDEDFEWLNQWKWCAIKGGRTFYAVRTIGKITISMHRTITNAQEGMQVDHANGNGLYNSRKNLRICTGLENQRNQRRRIDNTSGYKGVTWNKKHKKWYAKIMVDGKYIHLGCFLEIEKAANAYKIAAKEYFGIFANTGV